jgi:hypothetical protein
MDKSKAAMPRTTIKALVAALAALSLAHAAAQAPLPQAPKSAPCGAAEHRQFDFWLGEWDVTNPAGRLVGHNRIESAHAGCALIEHWTGAGGVTGTSLNVYDRDRRQWHQTWVDSGGDLLQLDGGIAGGAMVLAGEASDPKTPAKSASQRITWTPQPDGRVRQLWESSTDAGKTWTVIFDGIYARRQ